MRNSRVDGNSDPRVAKQVYPRARSADTVRYTASQQQQQERLEPQQQRQQQQQQTLSVLLSDKAIVQHSLPHHDIKFPVRSTTADEQTKHTDRTSQANQVRVATAPVTAERPTNNTSNSHARRNITPGTAATTRATSAPQIVIDRVTSGTPLLRSLGPGYQHNQRQQQHEQLQRLQQQQQHLHQQLLQRQQLPQQLQQKQQQLQRPAGKPSFIQPPWR